MRTLLAILILGLSSAPVIVVMLLAEATRRFWTKPTRRSSGRTVLLTGGKMTKCLQLARLFRASGDRVIVVETPRYRWCGTRFSSAVDAFFVVPDIEGDGARYRDALVEIAAREKVDLFVPVASPRAAVFDAVAKPHFPAHTEVFHFDESVVRRLDDKHEFMKLATEFGLSAPESHYIDSKEAMLDFDFPVGKRYVLKKVDYDPVHRLDLRTLPHDGWRARVEALPIGPDDPWVLQEYLEGREVCTHTTTRDGGMNLYVCSDSSPFQVNYEMLPLGEVRQWVQSFVRQLNATGQISFDFMVRDDGTVVPIECNPRTHSAITLFHNQPAAAAAYYRDVDKTRSCEPNEEAGHTYWLYHELHRLLHAGSLRRARFLVERIATGKEAVFRWHDPWPFWFHNHVNIVYQIVQTLRAGGRWEKVDFNIGKIIVPGGD